MAHLVGEIDPVFGVEVVCLHTKEVLPSRWRQPVDRYLIVNDAYGITDLVVVQDGACDDVE